MSRKIKYHLAALLLLGVFSGISAQKTGVSASFGGAAFAMDDMKYLQENILASYPIEGAIISSFPPYLTASAEIVHQFFTHLRAGIAYNYTTTGARSDYSDYTGNVETDMNAISHRFGVSLNYSILAGDRLDLSLYGELDANLSYMDIISTINVLGLTNGVQNKYTSLSPSGSAGLELLYNFKESALGIEAGYMVDLQGDLSNRESGTDLLDPNDRDRILTTDWSGWRIGLKGIVWIR